MMTLPLEVGNLDGLVYFFALIMIGPAVLLAIIGGILFSKQKKKAGKVFFILAGVYLLISFGACGLMLGGF
jgi:glucose uptake protein GlcU|tara:strand:- start:1337 stop:1549 length:213 start_codon:yes stop_codon:yes gene_type:complete